MLYALIYHSNHTLIRHKNQTKFYPANRYPIHIKPSNSFVIQTKPCYALSFIIQYMLYSVIRYQIMVYELIRYLNHVTIIHSSSKQYYTHGIYPFIHHPKHVNKLYFTSNHHPIWNLFRVWRFGDLGTKIVN